MAVLGAWRRCAAAGVARPRRRPTDVVALVHAAPAGRAGAQGRVRADQDAQGLSEPAGLAAASSWSRAGRACGGTRSSRSSPRWSSRRTRLFTRNADGSASNLMDAQAEPGLQQVNELIFSLLAADLDALADKFTVVAQPVGADGWTLTLTPRDANIAQVPRARHARGRARRADGAHRGGARRRHADPLLAPGAVRRRWRADEAARLPMSVARPRRAPVRRLRWQVAAWAVAGVVRASWPRTSGRSGARRISTPT